MRCAYRVYSVDGVYGTHYTPFFRVCRIGHYTGNLRSAYGVLSMHVYSCIRMDIHIQYLQTLLTYCNTHFSSSV